MNKKLILFSSMFIFVLLIGANIVSNINTSENISDKILRFHVLANSDDECDQNLKLKVRDEILNYSKDLYNDCNSVKQAVEISKNNATNFNKVASKVIAQNGYNYPVKTYITKEYYNTRVYDNFTLPAGIYDSLKVVIGSGEGHNWWCVVFPTVCLSGCTSDFDEYLTDEELELIENDKCVVKFKIVEIYEKLKSILKKEA